MKKARLLLIPLIVLPLVACSTPKDDNSLNFKTQDYTFHNFSQEYTIADSTLVTYYYENTEIPYVDVREFLNSINGLLNSSSIQGSLNRGNNQLTLSVPISGSIVSFSCTINWEDNTVKVNSNNFFSAAMKAPQASDFSAHMTSISQGVGNENIDISHTYDLGKYGIEIYYFNEKVLMPFNILNLLFCSQNMYNIYFNGNGYYGMDYYFQSDDQNYQRIMSASPWAGTKHSDSADNTFTLKYIQFTMDNFYGLKDYFNIDNFTDYIATKGLEGQLTSSDPQENLKGYMGLFLKNLDEMHTSLITPSFYNPTITDEMRNESRGSTRINFLAKEEQLTQAKTTANIADNSITYSTDNTTAILHFDSFQVGTKDQINGPDPWKFDTYELFKYFFREISAKPSVTKVVIDLSTNGGGTLGAMIKSLGYLTDNDIILAYTDSQTNLQVYQNYRVDVNGDEQYSSNESYAGRYQYAVLSSNYTYSAANYFTELFKANGIGTVLGERSGGGMSAVLPFLLPDGTGVAISGPTNLNVYDPGSNTFSEVQSGVPADVSVPIENYYDDDFLSSLF